MASHSYLPCTALSQKLLFKTQIFIMEWNNYWVTQLLIFPQAALKCHSCQLQTELTILQKYSLSLWVAMYFVSITWWSASSHNLSFIPKFIGRGKQALSRLTTVNYYLNKILDFYITQVSSYFSPLLLWAQYCSKYLQYLHQVVVPNRSSHQFVKSGVFFTNYCMSNTNKLLEFHLKQFPWVLCSPNPNKSFTEALLAEICMSIP